MNKRWMVLALAGVLMISSMVMLNLEPVQPMGLHSTSEDGCCGEAAAAFGGGRLQLALSDSGHFFSDAVEVALIASVKDAKIYYTTDGTEPTTSSRLYTRPLRFASSRGITVVPLKAIAVYETVTTQTLTHTFFIGDGIDGRFDTLIFSLSTDPDHLYDFDDGIFVAGRTRRDYIRENPNARIDPPSPANFNWRGMEGERPVYTEVFTPDGQRVVAQATGIRAHGGWSRAADQKSIRLVPRRMYEHGMGRFHFDFFPDDLRADEFGSPITRYDQLVLRNGANDRDFGMLRHEVACHMARQAGLRTATPARAAAIFLNGEYYGFAWLQVRFNEQYLQDIYNAPTRDFQIVGMGERWIHTDCAEEREAIEHMNSFASLNLTLNRNFNEFEALVDVDDLLLYYAYQTYMGNWDWPQNNLKRWRYTGPQAEGLAPELDGRWRYITFDLDWTLGLYDNPVNPNIYPFQELMNPRNMRYSPLLEALLRRQDMQDRFAMIMCDLMANIVTEQNVRETIDLYYTEAYHEIEAALRARKYAGWVGKHTISENHNNMMTFARGRGDRILRSLRNYFDWEDDMFTVNVTGGEAVIGTQKGASSRYFAHMTIPLRPVLPKFTVFDHWIVNGVKSYEEEITVSIADARNGAVDAELVTREELPQLMFTNVYASSARAGCVLTNPTGLAVRTEGMFISNDPNNLFLWELPAATVAPEGTLQLAGRHGAGPGDLMFIQLGFPVRSGMVLILSDAEGNVIDHINVP
jgi:hypothetical protein